MDQMSAWFDSFWTFSSQSSSSNATPRGSKILPESFKSYGFPSYTGQTGTSTSSSSSRDYDNDDASSEETEYTSDSSQHCVLEENYMIMANPNYMADDDVSTMVDSVENMYDDVSVEESMYSAISGMYSKDGTEYSLTREEEDEISRTASNLASSVVSSLRSGDDSTRNSRFSFRSSKSRNSAGKNSKVESRKSGTVRRSNKAALKTIDEDKVGTSGLDISMMMDEEIFLREKYKEYLREKMRDLWVRIHELAKRDRTSKFPLTDEDTQLLVEFYEKKLMLESLEKSLRRRKFSRSATT